MCPHLSNNNPINLIDPSGHSWLSELWDDIKDVVKPIVAVVAAVATFAIVAPAAYSLFAFGNLTTAACVASETAHIALTGASWVVGGAAAGVASAAIMGGNVGQGAAVGAISGGIAAFTGALPISNIYAQGMAQIGSGAISGGIASEMTGGTFWDGFRTGAITSFAAVSSRYLYNKWVRYDVTTDPSGEAVEKRWDTYPVEGANNVGYQAAPESIWAEGKPISKFFNRIPGINATGGLHDVFQVNIDKYMGNFARSVLSVPGMLPAAAVTYQALTVDRGLTAIYRIREKK